MIKNYSEFRSELLQEEFNDRDMDLPKFEYIRHFFTNNAPKDFADGNNLLNHCTESVEIIYKIMDNDTCQLNLSIKYTCYIHGHSGGIADYELKIQNYKYNGPNDEDSKLIAWIVCSYIMCSNSKIIDLRECENIICLLEEYIEDVE